MSAGDDVRPAFARRLDLAEAVKVLRDEVLDTVEQGDREPPGAEVFDAIVGALHIGGDAVSGLELDLHGAVARRLAWGDAEESVLADAEAVFDRVSTAVERAFADPADRMVVFEVATQVAVAIARVVALVAVARATRDRAARLREEITQHQLEVVLDRQRTSLVRIELETKR